MAKGAATENQLGAMHSTVTKLFQKILQGYLSKLEAFELLQEANGDKEEVLNLILAADIEPSPAMLSAMTKFLKDNEISYDSEQIDALSGLEQRLKDKKAQRPDFDNVTQLPLTGTS